MGPAKKNTLTFGLVNIPVGLVSATKSNGGGGLKMIAPVVRDGEGNLPSRGAPVSQRYVDLSVAYEADGVQVVPTSALHGRDECDRAVERGKDTQTGEEVLQPVDAAMIDELAERVEYMQVLGFVPEREAAPYLERGYDAHYVQPQQNTPSKPLGLLRAGLKAEKAAAIVKFSVGTKERIGLLRRRADDSLLVTSLRFAAQWKQPDEEVLAPAKAEVNREELRLVRQLIGQSTVDASLLDDVADLSAERRAEFLEKVLSGAVPAADLPQQADGVDELMAALEASIAQTKAEGKKRARAKAVA